MTLCRICMNLAEKARQHKADVAYAKAMLRRHGDKYGGTYVTQFDNAQTEVERTEADVATHVERDHGGVAPTADRLPSSWPDAPTPVEIPDGRAVCPMCSKVVLVEEGVRLRKHQDADGFPCSARVLAGVRLSVVDAPPISVPAAPRSRQAKRPSTEPSRLDAGSSCEDCGKWLPGERRVCGRCQLRRSA